ncbi:MAG: DUF1080 domain-containing protein [Acidobacteria bacterium]|nr:DUF1080 domain-containing protein [Acidobacteriota bacterium]MDA1236677.1 DUF1080 domain-containing protein [Acidobacteriota bacterium]
MPNDSLSRRELLLSVPLVGALGCSNAATEALGFQPLFDGVGLAGWQGDESRWLVEAGTIVGRSPGIEYNDFLATERSYGDFMLRFQIHLLNNSGNSGVQFRSERAPGDTEMIGYQADVGPQYWASLYDESRRRETLAAPDNETLERALKPNDWNEYEIHAQGPRIVLKLNGIPTVDYLETDAGIPLTGRIALQIHSGPAMEVRYRDIQIREL